MKFRMHLGYQFVASFYISGIYIYIYISRESFILWREVQGYLASFASKSYTERIE